MVLEESGLYLAAFISCTSRAEAHKDKDKDKDKDRAGGLKPSQGSTQPPAAQTAGHPHGPVQAHTQSQHQGSRTKSPLKETTHGNVTSKENTDDGDEGRQNR